MNNPLKMCGIEFTEFASPDNSFMEKIFLEFGFSKLKKHNEKIIEKTANKFCLITGNSNFIIFPMILIFRELEIS